MTTDASKQSDATASTPISDPTVTLGAGAPASTKAARPTTFSAAMAETSGVEVTIRSLLDAGAHFGHQTERWNPKMLPYIYGERNGIHVINLDVTLKAWKRARDFVVNRVGNGGTVLFVGTKIQAREIVKKEASRCGAFYVTSRWLGGTLTNFQTIKNSIDRMRKLEDLLEKANAETSGVRLNKKEKLTITRQLERLESNIGGIRMMKRAPDVIFVLDLNKEDIAVAEARRLNIPIVALVDTNVDPDPVNFPIPSNDDAARTVQLFMSALGDAIIEGRKLAESRNIRFDESGAESSGESNPRPHRRHRGGEGRGADAERQSAAPTPGA